MKNIILRGLSGIVYTGLIIGAIFWNQLSFTLLLAVFGILAIGEFNRLLPGKRPKRIIVLTYAVHCAVFTIASLKIFITSISLAYLLALLLPIIASLGLHAKKGDWAQELGYFFLALAYITLPLLLLSKINSLQFENTFSVLSLSLFLLIWTNDTFAFLSGMAVGRHPLFERISPKKTWEGFAGGLVACLALGYGLYHWFGQLDLWQWLLYAFLVSIASVYGDFFESYLKRKAEVKDSGKLIPGHGGILDRIDSVLFAAPIIFVLLQIIS